MLSGIVAFTFAILANSSPCESTARSFFDASSAWIEGAASPWPSSARGAMQAMAATPIPPATRKPLPSPAAAVESCLPARRAADAKRENIVCWEKRSNSTSCEQIPLVDGEEGSLISFSRSESMPSKPCGGVCGTCSSTIYATENDPQAHRSIHVSKRRALTRTIEERPQGPICIAPCSAHTSYLDERAWLAVLT